MIKPPKFSRAILRTFTPKHIVEELEGDLYEDFLENIDSLGVRKARRIYNWTVLRSFRPYLISTNKTYRQPKLTDMINYHIKMAFRSFSKNRLNTTIHLFGLVTGFACCMAIALFIIDNRSMDNFLDNPHQIYRLEAESIKDGKVSRSASHHINLPHAVAQYSPDILAYTRLNPGELTTEKDYNGTVQKFSEKSLQVDPGFFDIFNYKFLQGDKNSLFAEPNTIVLTESTAQRYFDNDNPIGMTLSLAGDKPDMKVVGVLQDIPGSSSLQFDVITGQKQPKDGKGVSFEGNFYLSAPVYVRLNENVVASEVASSIPAILKNFTEKPRFVDLTYSFKSLEEVRSDTELDDELIASTDQRVIVMFTILAVLIMSLVVINYVNLSTAQAITRSQEVGIRKVTGANRRTLLGQFMSESIILALVALPLSILILEMLIPYFEQILGRSLFYDYKSDLTFISSILLIDLMLGLVAGIYPSLLLSRFRFAEFLKGNLATSKKGSWLRKGLITFQFIFSIALIIGALLVQSQLDFIRSQSRAYNPEQIIVLKPTGRKFRNSYKTFKQEIANIPGVLKTSAASMAPGQDFTHRSNNQKIPFQMNRVIVDEDYFDLFGIEVVHGRDFNFNSDSASFEVIINESMAAGLEMDDPLQLRGVSFQRGEESRIIGVVSDFHFQSLHHNIAPVLFNSTVTMSLVSEIIIKTSSSELGNVLTGVEKIWNEFFPEQIFEFEILEDRLQKLYTSEQRIADFFNIFTLVTVIISCLGLFGLSAYTAQIKLKEVSIRKVLGAKAIQVWMLMTSQIYLLLLVASLIAIPISIVLVNGWLEDFAYRTSISPTLIGATLVVSFIVAGLTMSYKVMRTVTSNPVDSLRNE